ncbi:molybdenum cofactor guanylyltransferase [uncultured Sphingomonas sp.]|uniref:molybdenum cofactor guanylyltransferase n=1 Tax=uncultured Sphingomonas sp. TaxID=158754 RepID=UPI0025E2FF31|nr:molybdenum cofactor guanylyltransferase [uncultured Sphingomonas sp.]
MRVLGAILCGGASSRFGSDKAFARIGGIALVERVRDAILPQVDGLVSCGRSVLGLEGLSDRPSPGLGPLGGLNAALHFAATSGFDAVLSVPCDAPFLPDDLLHRLRGGVPHHVEQLPVIGLWPSALAPLLDQHLAEDARRSMRGWAERAGATPVRLGPIANVNAREDLTALERDSG